MKNLVILALAFSMNVWGQDVYSDQFQRIQKVELLEVVENDLGEEEEILVESRKMPSELDLLVKASHTKSNVSGVIMEIKAIIALGKEIYKIVEAGRPVVNTHSEPVQILPKDEKGNIVQAFEMSNWKAPRARKYRVSTQNYLGMTPASFDFMLIYSYGGKYRGTGAYITGAQIKPVAVNVKWGYSLNADFKVQSIMNQGSESNPVAGAVLMIDYKISTVLQDSSGNATFHINGLGQTTTY
jgi:hypothetical protein